MNEEEPTTRMEFQRRLERVCAIRTFIEADVCILRVALARLLDATDLQDTLQWAHILRSLLAFYLMLCLINAMEDRGFQWRYQAAVATGVRKWFFSGWVRASERERCMDQLTLLIADEMRRNGPVFCQHPHVRQTIEALAA